MANVDWQCPSEWTEWGEWLAAGLHARNRWRLPVLLTGILFARGRRTVTTWLRAVGIRQDYADYYYFLAALFAIRVRPDPTIPFETPTQLVAGDLLT